MQLTAVYQKVEDGFVAFVEELPGANTQGKTLEEARENLAEAIELVLDANRALAQELTQGQEVIRERIDVPPA
jgi:predicted RNase H-like HicB family nuclease